MVVCWWDKIGKMDKGMTIQEWEEYMIELLIIKDRKRLECFIKINENNETIKQGYTLTEQDKYKIRDEIFRVGEIIRIMKHRPDIDEIPMAS